MREAVSDTLFPMPEAKPIDGGGLSPVEAWKLFLKQSDVQGGLIPMAILPDILKVSKQRVHQLVDQGRMKKLQLFGTNFVTGPSFEEFVVAERKSGRPVKNPGNIAMVKAAVKGAMEIQGQLRKKK